MKVQRDVKRLGGIKTPVDMMALILVHIRTPTQHRQPHLQRFAQHALRHAIVKQAFLRKRDQLHVKHPGAFRLHLLHGLDTPQADEVRGPNCEPNPQFYG